MKHTTHFEFLKKKINVLVVDDDTAVLNMLVETLNERLLFNAVGVTTGKDAVKEIETGKYLLCLSDLAGVFPAGAELTLVHKFGKKIPVIMLSGCSSRHEVAMAIQAGAYSFLDKPLNINSDKFNSIVKDALLESLFIRRHGQNNNEDYQKIFRALKQNPENVTRWAALAGVEIRQIGRLCEACPFAPRECIRIYNLVSTAFDCSIHSEPVCKTRKCDKIDVCHKAREYYYIYQRVIDEFLS